MFLDAISHRAQNSLALLYVIVVVQPQSVREEEGWKVLEASVFGCSGGVLDVRLVTGRHVGVVVECRW